MSTIAPLDADEPAVTLHDAPEPAPVADSTPIPAEPVDEPVPAPADPEPPATLDSDPPVPSRREQLIKKLTGEEDEPPAEVVEEPKDDLKSPEAPAPKTDEPAKPVDPPQDDDLKPVTNEDIKALKPGEARRRITRLVTRIVAAEPLAKGYQEIVDLCTKNDMSPADYKAWVKLGIGIQQGDEEAVKSFTALSQKLGIVPEAAPAAAPSLSAELDAWLEHQTKTLEMSPAAVAELRTRLGGGKPPAPAAPAPAPSPAPRAAPAPPAPAPADPERVARTRAVSEIEKIATEYETRIGVDNFKALEPRIMAELAKRKGKHPDAWTDIFRSVVETELARAPKPALIGSSLRPGNGGAPPAKPAFKSERERVIHSYTS